jgi:hypothetical protein
MGSALSSAGAVLQYSFLSSLAKSTSMLHEQDNKKFVNHHEN